MKFLVWFLVLLVMGCATRPHPYDLLPVTAQEEGTEPADESIDETLLHAQNQALQNLRARQVARISDTTAPSYSMDTKASHPKVQKWIKYYSGKDRERFQRFLNRGAKYKEIVQDLLITNGLPPDLYYLGILESGYVNRAVSHAGAVGPWQFMAPTGRQYGLKINNYVDERIDPIRSTLAAIRYLKELHRIKKTWPLALAAYNAGPGRVRGAMRRGGSQSYWDLTQRMLLPYDTREYVPQFLAILTIGKNPAAYGFVERAKSPLRPMELVKVPGPVALQKVSELGQIPLKDLKSMNPHLIKDVTPPGQKSYPLWVEKRHVAQLGAMYNQLAAHRISGLKVQRSIASHRGTKIHRVRRGQHLSMIARRYGTSVSQIKRLNNLSSSRIYVGQKLRVKGSSKTSTSPVKKSLPVATKNYYVVRSGDNLISIAKSHDMTLSQIKSINNLSRSTIYKGQKLKVSGSASSVQALTPYRIRRGDNLHKIARKFGTTVKDIKETNNLSSNKIMKGQLLKIATQ
jgi:membrane-bound lytic murein transglycosylase D